VDGMAGDHESPGEWIHLPGGRIRFMPLASGHAPHLFGIQLYRGEKALAVGPPSWDRRRVGGRPDPGLPHRLSGSGGPSGLPGSLPGYRLGAAGRLPPADGGRGLRRSRAILCPPGFQQVDRYPEGILERMAPSLVLLGHWENFFRSRTAALRPVPTLDLAGFLARMEAVLPEGARVGPTRPWGGLSGGGGEGVRGVGYETLGPS
jgi:hypothetical protein